MHSDLMKKTVFEDLHYLYPDRITNKTNGITFRRWLMLANPKLTELLREACGEAVLDDPSQLAILETRASDNAFQQQFRSVKHHNKVVLARLMGERLNIKIDPSALFDVQIKRIHEYKRQLLQHHRGRGVLSGDQGRTAARLGAAREDLCRQGGRSAIATPS